MKKTYKGKIEGASPRPWRIEHVTRQLEAVVKGADNSIAVVCHADEAELIVAAVNAYGGTNKDSK